MTRRGLLLLEIVLVCLVVVTAGVMVWMARSRTLPGASAAAFPTVAAMASAPTAVGDSGGLNDLLAVLGIGGTEVEPLPTVHPDAAARAVALMAGVNPTRVATATPMPSPTPSLAPPLAVSVNGVSFEHIVVMPPDVVAHVRELYAAGQALGRNPRAYSKIGDSTTENPHFMARFDGGPYDLGDFGHLQPVVAHFAGSHARDSIAVRIGLHSWSANDPAWAEPGLCLPNETPVACELRVHNPAIVLIRLGTNDVGVAGMFDANVRQIVQTALDMGVIPVIGTKGDRHEGSNENNDILRRIAADYRIPLWDYDRVAETLPGRGLDVDAAHMMTYFAHDYRDPTAFTRGHAMHNLTALMVLDAIWRLALN